MVDKITKSRTKSNAPWKVSNSAPYLPPASNKSFGNANSIAKSKLIARDPRFSDLSGIRFNNIGKLNVELFRKSYNFLDELRDVELHELEKFVNKNKSKNDNKVAQLDSFGKLSLQDAKRLLNKYKSHKNAIKKNREFTELKHELKRNERIKTATSQKKPFYYSDNKIKKILKESKRDVQISNKKLSKKEAANAKKMIKSLPLRRD